MMRSRVLAHEHSFKCQELKSLKILIFQITRRRNRARGLRAAFFLRGRRGAETSQLIRAHRFHGRLRLVSEFVKLKKINGGLQLRRLRR